MYKKLMALVIAGAILVPAIVLNAKVYNNSAAGVSIDTPPGWKVEVDGEALEIQSPDELVMIMFVALDAENLEEAVDEAEKELKKVIKNVKEGEVQNGNHNGMKYAEIEGTGTVEGVEVEWGVSVVVNKKPVMILNILLPGWEKHQGTLKRFVNNIKKS